jgi:hypothetical protein
MYQKYTLIFKPHNGRGVGGIMSRKYSYKELETLGRRRLSGTFYLREFLHSEIAQHFGVVNAPDDVDLATEAGSALCGNVLEPIQNAWGRVHIRSGYRSPEVNGLGNKNRMNCASNTRNAAAHIWDQRDEQGYCGATACIVIPAYREHFERTGDWMSLAWWIHFHIPDYYEMCFFKEQCALNIRWYEGNDGKKSIKTYLPDPETGQKSALISRGIMHQFYQSRSPADLYQQATKLLHKNGGDNL